VAEESGHLGYGGGSFPNEGGVVHGDTERHQELRAAEG
jgi:hypothetical protein